MGRYPVGRSSRDDWLGGESESSEPERALACGIFLLAASYSFEGGAHLQGEVKLIKA